MLSVNANKTIYYTVDRNAKLFTTNRIAFSAILFLLVLFVLPAFGPPVILTGSAVAMVACALAFRLRHRESVLVPVSLTSGLVVLAVFSWFGP